MIGIVVALETERRWIPRDRSLLVERCGMGSVRAEEAARRLLTAGADALVSWGSAGGLDPSLDSGTIVIPDRILDGTGAVRCSDHEWSGRLRGATSEAVSVVASPLLHNEKPIQEPHHKQRLFADTGAVAVDMETLGVARVADEVGVPWIAVRVVVDPADAALPALAVSAIRADGRVDPAIGLRIVSAPSQWRQFLALARANRVAGRAMRRLWLAAEPELARKLAR